MFLINWLYYSFKIISSALHKTWHLQNWNETEPEVWTFNKCKNWTLYFYILRLSRSKKAINLSTKKHSYHKNFSQNKCIAHKNVVLGRKNKMYFYLKGKKFCLKTFTLFSKATLNNVFLSCSHDELGNFAHLWQNPQYHIKLGEKIGLGYFHFILWSSSFH